MPETVAGKFMPTRVYLAHQSGEALRDPTNKEKSSPDVMLFKQIEYPPCICIDARRPPLPRAPMDRTCESLHHEIIFNIDTEDVLRRGNRCFVRVQFLWPCLVHVHCQVLRHS